MLVRGLRVGIVGGSLAGLSTALALHAKGAQVRIFERGPASFASRGGGLGVDLALCQRLATSADVPPHLRLHHRRIWRAGVEDGHALSLTVTSYGALWRWLYAQLPAECVQFSREVARHEEAADEVLLYTADECAHLFDLVVAADGGRSTLRRAVLGPQAERRYAGYVLWRGLAPVAPQDALWRDLTGRLSLASRGSHHFVAYPIPSEGGNIALNWGWYHPTSRAALEALAPVVHASAPHTLGRSEGARSSLAEVVARASGQWPQWVEALLARTQEEGVSAPHPVFEFAAETMARGRVALVGDAAHLASPITGAGGRMAMADAITLAEALGTHNTLTAALEAFTARQSSACAAVVQEGMRLGAVFRHAQS